MRARTEDIDEDTLKETGEQTTLARGLHRFFAEDKKRGGGLGIRGGPR